MKKLLAIALFALLAFTAVKAQVPEQAQASNLAVPDQKPYTGAILVVQCKQAIAGVLIGHDGSQHPLHFQDMTQAMLLTQLSQAPADQITEIEVRCPAEKAV